MQMKEGHTHTHNYEYSAHKLYSIWLMQVNGPHQERIIM